MHVFKIQIANTSSVERDDGCVANRILDKINKMEDYLMKMLTINSIAEMGVNFSISGLDEQLIKNEVR